LTAWTKQFATDELTKFSNIIVTVELPNACRNGARSPWKRFTSQPRHLCRGSAPGAVGAAAVAIKGWTKPRVLQSSKDMRPPEPAIHEASVPFANHRCISKAATAAYSAERRDKTPKTKVRESLLHISVRTVVDEAKRGGDDKRVKLRDKYSGPPSFHRTSFCFLLVSLISPHYIASRRIISQRIAAQLIAFHLPLLRHLCRHHQHTILVSRRVESSSR
jgi:hypothetical protein